MSGTYRHLAPGRYQLDVDIGQGPAGVRRPDGRNVVVGVNGGTRSFALERSERVYYWWRGPRPRAGVRLVPRESRREIDHGARRMGRAADPRSERDRGDREMAISG